jgi:hypothetical protein
MSQPVGGQYGLELRRPELYETPLKPIDSRDLVSDDDYREGTEFGGAATGLIQPPPHVPTASERLHMIYAIDPEDDGTRTDSVVAPELDGNFGSKAL